MPFLSLDVKLPSDVVVDAVEVADFGEPWPRILCERVEEQSVRPYYDIL